MHGFTCNCCGHANEMIASIGFAAASPHVHIICTNCGHAIHSPLRETPTMPDWDWYDTVPPISDRDKQVSPKDTCEKLHPEPNVDTDKLYIPSSNGCFEITRLRITP